MTLPPDPNSTVRIDAPTGVVDPLNPLPRHPDGCGCTCGAHVEWLRGRESLQREQDEIERKRIEKILRDDEFEQQFRVECAKVRTRLGLPYVAG